MQEMPFSVLVRAKIQTDDTGLEPDLRALEERTERQVEVIKQLFEEKKDSPRRRTAAGRDQAGQGATWR